jgi:hypothetical protein
MSSTKTSFFDIHLLLLGATYWIEQRQAGNYNLPDLTKWAFHHLSAMQFGRGEQPALTHEGMLRFLTHPIEELVDSTHIPENLTAYSILDNFPVETEYDVADGVREYLQEQGLEGVTTIKSLVEMNENSAVQSIHRQLAKQFQASNLTDDERLEIEAQYTRWRSFFTVQHNVVNPVVDGFLFDTFWQEIRDEFYEPAYLRQSRVVTQSSNYEPIYFISPNCGLLYRNTSGAFEPVTACPEFEGVGQAMERPVRDGDFILKQTHQRRILIPGIPEHRLFETLQSHPNLQEMRLYPGVDRYDLLIILKNGERHAIDVKDHRRPYALERQLSGKRAIPHIAEHEENLLGFDKFVYLIPQSRVRHYSSGLSKLINITKRIPDLFVMTIERYVEDLSHV